MKYPVSPYQTYINMIRILADNRRKVEQRKKEIKVGYHFGELSDMRWYMEKQIVRGMKFGQMLLEKSCKFYGIPGDA